MSFEIKKIIILNKKSRFVMVKKFCFFFILPLLSFPDLLATVKDSYAVGALINGQAANLAEVDLLGIVPFVDQCVFVDLTRMKVEEKIFKMMSSFNKIKLLRAHQSTNNNKKQ
jgi:hypothetical protein